MISFYTQTGGKAIIGWEYFSREEKCVLRRCLVENSSNLVERAEAPDVWPGSLRLKGVGVVETVEDHCVETVVELAEGAVRVVVRYFPSHDNCRLDRIVVVPCRL